jgi:hypothetical protein
LKDWCITKELALDRREWKLAIHVSELWSLIPSFYCLLSSFFLFFIWFFYRPLFSIFLFGFFIAFCFSFFFAHVVSSLAYPNLLGNKKLGCCCCVGPHKTSQHIILTPAHHCRFNIQLCIKKNKVLISPEQNVITKAKKREKPKKLLHW